MFEPIHGSAPKYAGTSKSNPLAAICAMGMLLEYTGHAQASARIEKAITETLAAGKIPDLSAGKCPPTSEIGDMIAGSVG